ncbi:MAG: hypothetical protein US89_C0008G0027 [Candidatus Peregrinibacteria bacterium GW2011_GWF2_38_29]|nr:MAG: hypothetical protein US89_C0008G0027 [Candidatus Peregrinibacteria bacterium GW2011_GWF2_38_29]HBB03162.1 hypothetical protein [Candidatus Peregrinibacteria bacterium]
MCVKIYAFIDSQNLKLAIKSAGWKLDFEKFRVYLWHKYHVQKAFIFMGYLPENKKFYAYLRRVGYILVFKPILKYKNGIIKGNCDGELILHCMLEYANFDKAVIVSGDGDFHCLIECLKQRGKLLAIGVPNRNQYSSLFRKFLKYCFYIADQKSFLEYKSERHVD